MLNSGQNPESSAGQAVQGSDTTGDDPSTSSGQYYSRQNNLNHFNPKITAQKNFAFITGKTSVTFDGE
jgi:hypothetical protein